MTWTNSWEISKLEMLRSFKLCVLFVNNRSTISLSYDGSVDLISFVRDTQCGDMNFEGISLPVMSKSHAKRVWGPQNLPQDLPSFGRFCRSPNSLRMGFTFLMDANTSKYFYNYFMGMKQTLISHWKFLKNLWNWEISFTFSWYLKISLFTFTS